MLPTLCLLMRDHLGSSSAYFEGNSLASLRDTTPDIPDSALVPEHDNGRLFEITICKIPPLMDITDNSSSGDAPQMESPSIPNEEMGHAERKTLTESETNEYREPTQEVSESSLGASSELPKFPHRSLESHY